VELEALLDAFPNNVEAATGSSAPAPRNLEVAVKDDQHLLWLRLELPLAYPEGGRFPELTHLMGWQSLETPATIVLNDMLRGQVQDFLREGRGLSTLVGWLQEHLLKRIGETLTAAPERPVTEEKGLSFELVGGEDLACEASDSSVPATPDTARGEEFARIRIIAHHHDEKLDATGLSSDRLRANLRRQPFFNHLKNKFPQVTGFLSFGKPALLAAEGPQEDLHKLISEVKKFPKWWDVAVEVFDRQKSVEPATWRAFTGFTKIKTEDIDAVLKSLPAEHCKLFEDKLVGTTLDQKKRGEKARKQSKR